MALAESDVKPGNMVMYTRPTRTMGRHPTKERYLQQGDIFPIGDTAKVTIGSATGKPMLEYTAIYKSRTHTHRVYLSSLELVSTAVIDKQVSDGKMPVGSVTKTKTCTCDMTILMTMGCQCGGV